MSNSSLVDYIKLSPNYSSRNGRRIDTITIHHMSGNLSVETCGNVFAKALRQASSNYGIGSDGRVGMYVEEHNRSWCSSSRANDIKAVTIEMANCNGAPNWEVSDVAMAKLIELCVDICKRNGINRLNYTGNTNGSLTMHCWFASTDCPGPFLKGKFPWIAEQVNLRLEQKGMYDVDLSKLSRGSKGNAVKALQLLLIGNGYDCGSTGADSSFGPKTETAVRNFQKDSNINIDGVVGNQTWSKLLK